MSNRDVVSNRIKAIDIIYVYLRSTSISIRLIPIVG